MGSRGRQGREAHLVPAQRQAQARRNRGVLLDHLQVAGATRPRQRQSDGGQAAGGHDGHEVAAVRRQADDLWPLRKPRAGVKRAYAAAMGKAGSPSMARSMASISTWVSINLIRARSALSRSNGAASVFAKASRSSAIRSRAFFSVSSRSLMSAPLSVVRAIIFGAKSTARNPSLTYGGNNPGDTMVRPASVQFPKCRLVAGAPDTIRTCDLCLRRATLYPAELRVRRGSFSRLAGRRQRPNLG